MRIFVFYAPRKVGPLKMAEDAVLLETDGKTIEDQVQEVMKLANEREQARLQKRHKN
jgi:cytidylate kinase